MKIALIGGVVSTQLTLEKLIEHNIAPATVYGYEPSDSSRVSGFVSLQKYAESQELGYKGFQRINDLEKEISNQKYDIIFVVGLSQLVSKTILDSAVIGCIGFHPTKLPLGRGRAPMAWMVLDQCDGASTFFVMGEGADDGPILAQEEFEVTGSDTAKSIEKKLLKAGGKALDKWLPKLANGEWNPVPQEERYATYYGRRTPEDGKIVWSKSAVEIDRLVRASSEPHPGAYFYFGNKKVIVWKSKLELNINIKGAEGRVLLKRNDDEFLIQCGSGLLWISELEGITSNEIKVGSKLQIEIEEFVIQLQTKIEELEERVKIL